MSSIALRWVAVPLGLLAFALLVACRFWLTAATWDLGLVPAMLLLLAAQVSAVGAPAGILLLVASRNRRPPAVSSWPLASLSCPPHQA